MATSVSTSTTNDRLEIDAIIGCDENLAEVHELGKCSEFVGLPALDYIGEKRPEKQDSAALPEKLKWSKSLTALPTFTIREIEKYRKSCSKQGRLINKTFSRGQKFLDERYIDLKSIYCASSFTVFYVKGQCKPSMRKGTKNMRRVHLQLSRKSGDVLGATCSCPAGLSGNCNHIMAFLLEIASYSLKQLLTVPDEAACTSIGRQWGIPSEKKKHREPVMQTSVLKKVGSKGISPTLYDPRLNKDQGSCQKRRERFQQHMQKLDSNNIFSMSLHQPTYIETQFGPQELGSPLSFQLAPVEVCFEVLTNLEVLTDPQPGSIPAMQLLPLNLQVLGIPCLQVPERLNKIKLDSLEAAQKIEQATLGQNDCQQWHEERKFRLTSTAAHSILKRQRNFENLAKEFLRNKTLIEQPLFIQERMRHGLIYEPVAREKYSTVMQFKLKRKVEVRETGLVIQPSIFWLAASPDGLAYDGEYGIIEVKCPHTKRDLTPTEMLSDKKFFCGTENGKPFLKKNHEYYSQIQLAMGLSAVKWCDVVIYSHRGMLILREIFDEVYFKQLVEKMTLFYKEFMLPLYLSCVDQRDLV